MSPSAAPAEGLGQAEAALSALSPLPFPIPLGRLAPAVERVFRAWPRGAWILCGPRERVGAILRGCPAERLVDPRHGARPYKLGPMGERPGARALHAVGLALASGGPVLCLLGQAAAASGDLHEALNLAALTGAPVVFLVLDAPLAPDAPLARPLGARPVELARAFGLPAEELAASALAASAPAASALGERLLAAHAAARPCLLHLTLS